MSWGFGQWALIAAPNEGLARLAAVGWLWEHLRTREQAEPHVPRVAVRAAQPSDLDLLRTYAERGDKDSVAMLALYGAAAAPDAPPDVPAEQSALF